MDLIPNELLVIALVALVVIGPNKLPEVVRTLGLWLGRLRRSFNAVKTEIEREVGMDEIKRQLHNEAVLEEMKRIEREVQNSIDPNHQAHPQDAALGTGDEEQNPESSAKSAQEEAVEQDTDKVATLNQEPESSEAKTPEANQPEASQPEANQLDNNDSEVAAVDSETDSPASVEPIKEPTRVPRSEAELEALHERRKQRDGG